jgi:hypothetical protein
MVDVAAAHFPLCNTHGEHLLYPACDYELAFLYYNYKTGIRYYNILYGTLNNDFITRLNRCRVLSGF